MTTERDDSMESISVRLNGKNYSYWNYVMKNFLRSKKMWGYVIGTHSKPIEENNEKYAEQVDVWEMNNSKIITWINNSVESLIGMKLVKYDTAKEVWDRLERLYTQSNFAKKYQLEMDIRSLTQKETSVQELYSAMSNLWDQLALTESVELRIFPAYIAHREEERLVQFLMALHDDFEAFRDNILHRSPLPSISSVVSELLAQEIRHKSETMKGILPPPSQTVLASHSRPHQNHNKNQSKPNSKPNERNFCHQPGHWKAQCPLLVTKSPLGSCPSLHHQIQFQTRQFKLPNTSTDVPSTEQMNTSATTGASSMFDALLKQFQKFLNQQHAMSVSASLSTPSFTGSSLQEADWDRS